MLNINQQDTEWFRVFGSNMNEIKKGVIVRIKVGQRMKILFSVAILISKKELSTILENLENVISLTMKLHKVEWVFGLLQNLMED